MQRSRRSVQIRAKAPVMAALDVVVPAQGSRAPPAAPPSAPGLLWATQPDRIEVIRTDGTARTCNGKPCACLNAGDVVHIYPPTGAQFPPRQTSFPDIAND